MTTLAIWFETNSDNIQLMRYVIADALPLDNPQEMQIETVQLPAAPYAVVARKLMKLAQQRGSDFQQIDIYKPRDMSFGRYMPPQDAFSAAMTIITGVWERPVMVHLGTPKTVFSTRLGVV